MDKQKRLFVVGTVTLHGVIFRFSAFFLELRGMTCRGGPWGSLQQGLNLCTCGVHNIFIYLFFFKQLEAITSVNLFIKDKRHDCLDFGTDTTC